MRELGLWNRISSAIGLDYQVGTAGRLLSPQERASVNLVRCLVKRPDILVIDGALAPFDEARSQQTDASCCSSFSSSKACSWSCRMIDRPGLSMFSCASATGQIVTEKTDKTAAQAPRSPGPKPDAPQRIAGEVA